MSTNKILGSYRFTWLIISPNSIANYKFYFWKKKGFQPRRPWRWRLLRHPHERSWRGRCWCKNIFNQLFWSNSSQNCWKTKIYGSILALYNNFCTISVPKWKFQIDWSPGWRGWPQLDRAAAQRRQGPPSTKFKFHISHRNCEHTSLHAISRWKFNFVFNILCVFQF